MSDKQLYDPACQECAEHFLAYDAPDTPEQYQVRVRALSYAIQMAVEDWLDSEVDSNTT